MLYLVKEITGGGYEQDDVGIFDSMKGACDAVLAFLDGKGLEATRYNRKTTRPGIYEIGFQANAPYYLHYIITQRELNMLTA